MQPHDTTRRAGDEQMRLAVLIDADNARAVDIAPLMAEIAKFGVAGVRRIYGDWTTNQSAQWKTKLLEHSLVPIQQFAYTTGKNATDSALIIDAMDLLYTGRFDGFCLVSSDSDFTRLSQRLREGGVAVFGFGERKTPKPFVVACDKFVYTDLLGADAALAVAPDRDAGPHDAQPRAAGSPAMSAARSAAPPAKPSGGDAAAMLELVARAVSEEADETGWAFLGAVGSYLTKIKPDFDPRLYGFRKLSEIVRAYPGNFDVSVRGPQGTPGTLHFVRLAGTGKPRDPDR